MISHYRAAKVAFVIILFGALSCSSPSEKPVPETSAANTLKPVTWSVEIKQMKFSPAELTVKKGDRVVFVNHDIVTHDITEESTRSWNSSPISTDQTWILVATESVNYYCSIHPVMKGKIIVEQSD
jgi:plastocyanin